MPKAKSQHSRSTPEVQELMAMFVSLSPSEQEAYLAERLWIARDIVARRRAAQEKSVRVRGMN